MKKITRIEISGFQSHKHTVIEPSDSLTAIVGHTDSGKSAFIRAIRWCLYNKAPHSPLINKDMEQATVTITFSDGTVITRGKNKKDNFYSVTNAKGETKSFTAVGNSPLKEVMDASGMHEVDIFNTDMSLNMTDQFDSLFFLSENPTDKGTLISQMANTEVVDSAIAICSTKIGALKRQITSLQKSIKAEKQGLAQYNYLEELANVLDELTKIKDDAISLSQSAEKISEKKMLMENFLALINSEAGKRIPIEDIERLDSEIQEFSKKFLDKEKMQKFQAIYDETVKLIASVAFLNVIGLEDSIRLLGEADSAEAEIIRRAKIEAKCSAIATLFAGLDKESFGITEEDIARAEEGFASLISLVSRLQKIKEGTNNIEGSVSHVLNLKDDIANLSSNQESIKGEYADLLKDSKTCPVCGQEMDEEHIHRGAELL